MEFIVTVKNPVMTSNRIDQHVGPAEIALEVLGAVDLSNGLWTHLTVSDPSGRQSELAATSPQREEKGG